MRQNKNKVEDTLFGARLAPDMEYFLYDTNPWWRGKPMRPLPQFRRWLFEDTLQRLKTGLAPVTVLRGPRQVGKTYRSRSLTTCCIGRMSTQSASFACSLTRFPHSRV